MQRVAKFEKVSYERFASDMKDEFHSNVNDTTIKMQPFFKTMKDEDDDSLREMYDKIQLPSRATGGSAGYDFKAPFSFTLFPGKTIKIPTGIRVSIDDGWWLGCLPRSGLGFKYRLQLNNTMGVIDSDYYFSDNEGHIFAKITNDSNTDKVITVEAGKGFLQAIFIPYGITYDDDVKDVRNGGMGSTDSNK